jgi:hypothetical protein
MKHYSQAQTIFCCVRMMILNYILYVHVLYTYMLFFVRLHKFVYVYFRRGTGTPFLIFNGSPFY